MNKWKFFHTNNIQLIFINQVSYKTGRMCRICLYRNCTSNIWAYNFSFGIKFFLFKRWDNCTNVYFFVEGILSYLPKYTFYCNRCIVPFFSLYRHKMSFMLMSLLFHASYSLLFIHKPYSIDHRDKMLTKKEGCAFCVYEWEHDGINSICPLD